MKYHQVTQASLLEQAKLFRKAFGQEMLTAVSIDGIINQDLWNMQLDLIEEECAELFEAADETYADPENDNRRVELLKELSDLVFVCYQFAAAFNLNLDESMRRIFTSNMSKLDDNGNPIYREDGKVLKGPNYKKPTLIDLV